MANALRGRIGAISIKEEQQRAHAKPDSDKLPAYNEMQTSELLVQVVQMLYRGLVVMRQKNHPAAEAQNYCLKVVIDAQRKLEDAQEENRLLRERDKAHRVAMIEMDMEVKLQAKYIEELQNEHQKAMDKLIKQHEEERNFG